MKRIQIEVKGNKAIFITVLLLIIVGAVWFYWYEWRPSRIRQECFSKATEEKENVLNIENNLVLGGFPLTKRADYEKIFEDTYSSCILEKGLEKTKNNMNSLIILTIYGVLVVISLWEKIRNYSDWLNKSKENEEIELQKFTNEMASRGFAQSGQRNQGEQRIKDNFAFKRRKKRRKHIKELAWSIIPIDVFFKNLRDN